MENNPTNRNQRETKNGLRNVDDTYIFDPVAGIYKPKSIETNEDRQRKQAGTNRESRFFTDPRTDWRILLVSVLTLLLLGATVHYARQQWYEMIRAANAANISAQAATSAANTADATLKNGAYQFKIDERPYVILDEFKSVIDAKTGDNLHLSFYNAGRTPALDFHFDFPTCSMLVGEKDLGNLNSAKTPVSRNPIAPSRWEVFNFPYWFNEPYKGRFNNDEIQFVVKCTVRYSDVFGHSHWTKFCINTQHSWGEFRHCTGEIGPNIMDLDVLEKTVSTP